MALAYNGHLNIFFGGWENGRVVKRAASYRLRERPKNLADIRSGKLRNSAGPKENLLDSKKINRKLQTLVFLFLHNVRVSVCVVVDICIKKITKC